MVAIVGMEGKGIDEGVLTGWLSCFFYLVMDDCFQTGQWQTPSSKEGIALCMYINI